MVNLNKYIKTKSKPLNQRANLRNVHMHAYHRAQLLHTVQHKTVLIIFPPNFQTIIKAQMLTIGVEVS